jgi:hypothetical protein
MPIFRSFSTFRSAVLNLFCAMDPFDSLVTPTNSFSENCIYVGNACNIVRFTEVNTHFWRLKAINSFVAYIQY